MISQADEENLDDSLDFNYGSQKVDANSYNEFLENEKSNFRLLINKVLYPKEYLLPSHPGTTHVGSNTKKIYTTVKMPLF